MPLNGTWQDNAIKVFQSLVEDVVLKMVVQEIKADGLSVSLYKNAGNVGPTQTDPLSVQKILIHKGLARGVGELYVRLRTVLVCGGSSKSYSEFYIFFFLGLE